MGWIDNRDEIVKMNMAKIQEGAKLSREKIVAIDKQNLVKNFHDYILTLSPDEIKNALKRKIIDVDAIVSLDKNDDSLFVSALKNNINCSIQEIKIMINIFNELGADLNARDREGDTALCKLIEQEKIEIIKFLIELGIDVNRCNKNNEIPLELAYKNKNEKIIDILLNAGADPINNFSSGKSFLVCIIQEKKQNEFEDMIRKQPDLRYKLIEDKQFLNNLLSFDRTTRHSIMRSLDLDVASEKFNKIIKDNIAKGEIELASVLTKIL
jgi:ankyrin repeat protein